jgi:RNA polymerase sigma-70 factor (ECF subfamily)
MRLVDEGSTSPTLLSQVIDWHDHPAWVRFQDTYDPYLRRWCGGYGLDSDAIDEICQRIWIELAGRMRSFEYDPSGSFRGWLRRLCRSRALNYLREQRAHPICGLGEHEVACEPADTEEGEVTPGPTLCLVLDAGDKIQSLVRARVKPHNWEAFWLVAVCDWGVERTAQSLGMKKAAVYAAVERVRAKLRDEGRRVSEHPSRGA